MLDSRIGALVGPVIHTATLDTDWVVGTMSSLRMREALHQLRQENAAWSGMLNILLSYSIRYHYII